MKKILLIVAVIILCSGIVFSEDVIIKEKLIEDLEGNYTLYKVLLLDELRFTEEETIMSFIYFQKIDYPGIEKDKYLIKFIYNESRTDIYTHLIKDRNFSGFRLSIDGTVLKVKAKNVNKYLEKFGKVEELEANFSDKDKFIKLLKNAKEVKLQYEGSPILIAEDKKLKAVQSILN